MPGKTPPQSGLTSGGSCRITNRSAGLVPVMPRLLSICSATVVATWLMLPPAAAVEVAPRKIPPAVSRKIDFAEDVKPILARSCTKCHANGKRKGGFNIDHIHTFVGGGDSGPAVVAGKGAEIVVWFYLTL